MSDYADRNARLQFCSPDAWTVKAVDNNPQKAQRLLREFPHALPFDQRFQMFRRWIEDDAQVLFRSEL